MNYIWDFSAVWRNGGMLLDGFANTALLTATCLVLALPLGLLLALMRLSNARPLRFLGLAYVNFFRAAPALVLIVWFYFAFPVIIGVEMNAFEASILAIGLQSAAYMAEVFRGGMQAIRRGQWEAARAIGLSSADTIRFVILPQAVRQMIPVFLIRFAELVKATTLAGVIAYGETVYMANELSTQTYRPLETFTAIALLFFVLIFGITSFSKLLEKRLIAGR
ncbi:amino acid ABC transporter permease [Sinorhizobium psoraleae]|uniref:amino acid ABC transporter permease n=1 Tax=Sinorhizobium psoraleae TaxID=520838 RepID=UPI0015694A36|nr:amino acid ABC transporter permease [Sinorhizobium psoraleae]